MLGMSGIGWLPLCTLSPGPYTITATTDAWLRATYKRNFTSDAWLRATYWARATTDAIAATAPTVFFTTDAILLAPDMNDIFSSQVFTDPVGPAF